ncbi:hypothetical protein [Erysipelothrix rhusiopathiae]|uniref:hypothetical protein n=1 Tax=Erysipelothrix rhusiopathiae TaxID=1648 RepID=UPI002480263F|nr:hypothetical protein [Erysipelothrix rhusiopathiae]
MDTLKIRLDVNTYNKAVKTALDFTLENYERGIKNEAMEIIDLTITNSIRLEIEPAYNYVRKVEYLQSLFRKNHGIMLKTLSEIKEAI